MGKSYCFVIFIGIVSYVTGLEVTVDPMVNDKTLNAMIFDVNIKSTDLFCNITVDNTAEKYDVVWKFNELNVDDIGSLKERISYPEDRGGHRNVLRITKPTETEVGNYTCVVMADSKEIARAEIKAISTLKIKVASNINVVEAEKLRIHCLVVGRPIESITWTINLGGNVTTLSESQDRYKLLPEEDRGIENAILLIDEAEMGDRGEYTCTVNGLSGTVNATSMVRIKDKYAALWPFLGICAEVFVLCAIILIYEKKRNKAELEESDTDQSPDQKQTPDHGKEGNLRHRN